MAHTKMDRSIDPSMIEPIPKTYKAAIYDRPGTASTKIVYLETPEPGPGQVLVRLTHSGVCHSDYSIMMNGWDMPRPTTAGQVGGHEGVGYVVKFGPGVEEVSPLQLGQRVGIKWVSVRCGICHACLAGRDGVCVDHRISGYSAPGTFQQYVVGPADYVTPIPDGLESASAAPMLCAGVTVYAALNKGKVTGGDWVVVSGAGGGLGHLATAIASKGLGARVIGIDHSSKEEVVEENGAEHFIAFDHVRDVPAKVKELTGGLGCQTVIMLSASNAAYEQGLRMLRVGGTMVCVAIPEGTPKPFASANPSVTVFGELSIVGSAVGNRKDAVATLDLAQRGVIKSRYRLAKLEELDQVFQDMEDHKILGRVVLDLQ